MEKEDENIQKLPTEEKCVHKNWKARCSGYEELMKIFRQLDTDKRSEWIKYGNIVRKFPCDSNAAAQEKALEATLAFLEDAPIAAGSRIVSEVMEGIVTKCVIALKSKSKTLATNVALMCVEIEKCETVQDELMKGLEHKNPKIVSGCISILYSCLAQFGPKVYNVKPVVKKILTLSEDRDKGVRDEVKKLLIEFYRWIGPSFKTQLNSVKPTTLQEIETEVLNLASEKAFPSRFLRSEQLVRGMEQEPNEVSDNNNITENQVVTDENQEDPFDLLEPFDILSNLPPGFYQKSEDKKWQERKEVLDKLDALLTANPKLDSGDYSDLVRKMKQIVTKDPHIAVATMAVKIIAGLARGLGKKFSPYAVQCLVGIFEKFKEKKPSVVKTLRDASDVCYAMTGLEAMQEDALRALQSKNPAIKQEVSLFMARAFLKAPMKAFSDKKIMNPYLTSLTVNINVSDPNVRDAAAEALGIALKVLGEKSMALYLHDLDAMKMQKVKEFAEKADIKPLKESQPITKSGKASLSANSTKSGVSRVNAENTNNGNSPVKNDKHKASTFRIVKGKAAAVIPTEEIIGLIEDAQILPINNAKVQRFADEAKQKILRWNFTVPREEFVDLLKELMGNAGINKDLITNMFHPDFKFHLKALETLVNDFKTNGHEGALSNLDLILKWLSIRFFDTNPSVLTKSLDYIQSLIEELERSSYRMADIEIYSFVPHLILKLGDSKDGIRSSAHNIIKLLCRISPTQKICSYVMDGLKSKNARQRVECLEEIAFMIPTFGLKTCFVNPSTGLKDIAKQIGDRDTSVRNSALNALVQAYFLEENKFYKMIGLLTAKDQSLLDERIKRAVKPNKSPQKQKTNPLLNTTIIMETEVGKPSVKEVQSPKIAKTGKLAAEIPVRAGISYSNVSIENQENELFQQKSCRSTKTGFDIPVIQDDSQDGGFTNLEDLDGDAVQSTIIDSIKMTDSGSIKEVPSHYLVDFAEIDRLFDTDEMNIMELKLKDTNIEDILNEPPLFLPEVRTRTRSVLSSRPNNKVPIKPSVEGLDFTIWQTGNSEMRVVIESLINLDVLITDENFHESLSEKIDNILSMAILQFRRMHPALACLPVNVTDDVNQYFLCILNTLKSIYKTPKLSTSAGKENTKELLYYLLILVTERNLTVLPDHRKITKEVNLLVVPIIENSNPVVIMCALVRLLNETTLYPNGVNSRILTLILKCLWRLIKQMGVWAKKCEHADWNLEPILTEFFLFLDSHPFSSYIGQDEMPIKTIKTVMHSLIMLVGASNMETQLRKVPKLLNSEGGVYISRVVNREKQKPPLEVRRKSFQSIIASGGSDCLPEKQNNNYYDDDISKENIDSEISFQEQKTDVYIIKEEDEDSLSNLGKLTM